jgi:hypothetical protein
MTDPRVVVRYSLLEESVAHQNGPYNEAVAEGTDAASEGDSLLKARFVAAWNHAIGELGSEDTGTTVMATAPNGVAARIQSLLVDYAISTGELKLVKPARSLSSGKDVLELAEILEVKFDNFDWIGWMKMAYLLVFKPKKSPWLPPPELPETLADDATIAIFADWGTGLYGAPAIANQISKMPRCDVALHLGDTYYAGRDREITNLLVEAWPKVQPKTVSRTLNGNHEMYSGGIGYFAALKAKKFGQSSSCFAMQNTEWLLLGLDSSYQDASIDNAQAEWVTRMVARAGSRKVILFSHHQVYSQFNSSGLNLQTALGPLLAAGRIYGWIFGHEHLMVVFDPHPSWGLRARCIGNGGFPEFRPKMEGGGGEATKWVRRAATPAVPAAEVLDGPNPFVDDDPSDPMKYAPHGYLVLEFAGKTVWETYLDPNGQPTRATTAL